MTGEWGKLALYWLMPKRLFNLVSVNFRQPQPLFKSWSAFNIRERYREVELPQGIQIVRGVDLEEPSKRGYPR